MQLPPCFDTLDALDACHFYHCVSFPARPRAHGAQGHGERAPKGTNIPHLCLTAIARNTDRRQQSGIGWSCTRISRKSRRSIHELRWARGTPGLRVSAKARNLRAGGAHGIQVESSQGEEMPKPWSPWTGAGLLSPKILPTSHTCTRIHTHACTSHNINKYSFISLWTKATNPDSTSGICLASSTCLPEDPCLSQHLCLGPHRKEAALLACCSHSCI